MTEKPRAFAIMPFDPEFNSIYEQLIKPSLEEAGYEVARADSFLDQQNILGSIVRGITTADLIIADLTTNNPNVFYELGLCHGLRVPTILLAQSIQEVPFDLRSYKIQIYETHFDRIRKLKDALKTIGEKHGRGEVIFGSPITDFASSIELPEKASETLEEKSETEIVEDTSEKGILDFLFEGEQASNELTKILSKILKDNQAITNKMSKHTASINALSNNPGAGTAGKFHKISLLAASDMNALAHKVEDILPEFERAIDRLNENYLGYINAVELEEGGEEQVLKFKNTIAGLLQGARNAKTGMQSYHDSVVGLGDKRISKDLNRASRRQAKALEGIVSNIERVEAFCIKTLTAIDEKLGCSIKHPLYSSQASARGLEGQGNLLDKVVRSDDSLKQRREAVHKIDALRKQLFAKYGEMPDSVEMVREIREGDE